MNLLTSARVLLFLLLQHYWRVCYGGLLQHLISNGNFDEYEQAAMDDETYLQAVVLTRLDEKHTDIAAQFIKFTTENEIRDLCNLMMRAITNSYTNFNCETKSATLDIIWGKDINVVQGFKLQLPLQNGKNNIVYVARNTFQLDHVNNLPVGGTARAFLIFKRNARATLAERTHKLVDLIVYKNSNELNVGIEFSKDVRTIYNFWEHMPAAALPFNVPRHHGMRPNKKQIPNTATASSDEDDSEQNNDRRSDYYGGRLPPRSQHPLGGIGSHPTPSVASPPSTGPTPSVASPPSTGRPTSSVDHSTSLVDRTTSPTRFGKMRRNWNPVTYERPGKLNYQGHDGEKSDEDDSEQNNDQRSDYYGGRLPPLSQHPLGSIGSPAMPLRHPTPSVASPPSTGPTSSVDRTTSPTRFGKMRRNWNPVTYERPGKLNYQGHDGEKRSFSKMHRHAHTYQDGQKMRQDANTYRDEPQMSQNANTYPDEPKMRQNANTYPDEPKMRQNANMYPDEPKMSQNAYTYPDESKMSQNANTYPDEPKMSQNANTYRDEPKMLQNANTYPDEPKMSQNANTYRDEPKMRQNANTYPDEPKIRQNANTYQDGQIMRQNLNLSTGGHTNFWKTPINENLGNDKRRLKSADSILSSNLEFSRNYYGILQPGNNNMSQIPGHDLDSRDLTTLQFSFLSFLIILFGFFCVYCLRLLNLKTRAQK